VGDHEATGAPSQNAAVPATSASIPLHPRHHMAQRDRNVRSGSIASGFTEATGLSAVPQNSIQGVLRRRTGMPAVNVHFGVICAR
jgi:hypothetical protein